MGTLLTAGLYSAQIYTGKTFQTFGNLHFWGDPRLAVVDGLNRISRINDRSDKGNNVGQGKLLSMYTLGQFAHGGNSYPIIQMSVAKVLSLLSDRKDLFNFMHNGTAHSIIALVRSTGFGSGPTHVVCANDPGGGAVANSTGSGLIIRDSGTAPVLAPARYISRQSALNYSHAQIMPDNSIARNQWALITSTYYGYQVAGSDSTIQVNAGAISHSADSTANPPVNGNSTGTFTIGSSLSAGFIGDLALLLVYSWAGFARAEIDLRLSSIHAYLKEQYPFVSY
jgi:hypothetical protein